LGKSALQTGRRRSPGRAYRQQDAAVYQLETERSSGVVQVCGSGGRRDVNAGTNDARRAGGTVLRRAEVAEEIVMLELRREQENGVKRYADKRSAISRPASHLIDDITGR
jgi:hypothetical protein